MANTCDHCGQPLPEIRLGVIFTPLKARVFDVVKRAGPDGIAWQDLYAMFSDRWKSWETMKSHMNQINELIDESGFRIYGRGGTYRLEKRRV